MFQQLSDEGPILKEGKDVYIKVNAIDNKKHVFTSPEVLDAVIRKLKELGASKIYVMENSTQGNFTRVVFDITGYAKICKEHGAKPLYLDEEPTQDFIFKGKPGVETDPADGYFLKKFRLPRTIVRIINDRDNVTYVDLPKLKTHSMGIITMGIKNQWGFVQQADRRSDHNYNLHSKLVDVYELIKPDFTIIDGLEGTIHDHYPPTALEDQLVKQFNILIGGRDTVAVDAIGARVFGLTMDEVPHLKIAHERGLGIADLDQITVQGGSLESYQEVFPTDLLEKFPDDILIVKGKDLCCREGCQNNPLSVMQVLAEDLHGKGGFFMVMGKGFDANLVDQLKQQGYARGLVAGMCAMNEVGQKLRDAFGKRNVFYSRYCNSLAETSTALFGLMKVNPLDYFPKEYPKYKILKHFLLAKLHGSKTLIPSIV